MAEAVREEVEGQLAAFGMLQAGQRLRCSHLWLGVPPHADVHQLVWDFVCLAFAHACERGRKAAWAVGQGLQACDLVGRVAVLAARGGLWDVLADFAATARVPRAARTAQLTRQPFVAWHVVATHGTGLRVVRRTPPGAGA